MLRTRIPGENREWLKVLRKAIVLWCCDAEPVGRGRSGILDVLIESCPSKVFCP